MILERNSDETVAGKRHEVKLTALGVDNGWFDAAIQARSNIDFAYSNPYRELINDTLYKQLIEDFDTIHRPAIEKCATEGTDQACNDAWMSYGQGMDFTIIGAWPDGTKTFDIRPGAQSVPSPEEYLAREDVRKAIGAQTEFSECTWPMGFIETGDGTY